MSKKDKVAEEELRSASGDSEKGKGEKDGLASEMRADRVGGGFFNILLRWNGVDWSFQTLPGEWSSRSDDWWRDGIKDHFINEEPGFAEQMLIDRIIDLGGKGAVLDSLKNYEGMFYPDESITRLDQTKRSVKTKLREILELEARPGGQEDFLKIADMIGEERFPWVVNREIMEALDKKEVDQRGIHRKIISMALRKSRRVTWHWRAVLPVLRRFADIEKDNKSLVIQMSHIRKWELLLCYEIDERVLKEYNEEVQHIPLRHKTLLIPPIFGISNRMHSWDAFGLLFSKYNIQGLMGSFDSIRQRERKAKESVSDHYTAREKASLIGRHDCYYIISSGVISGSLDRGNFRKYHAARSGFLSASNFGSLGLSGGIGSPVVGDAEGLREMVRGVTGAMYYRMETKNFINFSPEWKVEVDRMDKKIGTLKRFEPYDYIELPSFTDDSGVRLLFSSDNFCVAMEELTNVLNDPTTKSLLIIAPPGSGKENLSQAAYKCRAAGGRAVGSSSAESIGRERGKFIATTLAGLSPDEASKILFRLRDSEAEDGRLRGGFSAKNSDGLFFKALGGALFIDEVDKARDDVRSMLLRVLESGEVNIPGTSIVVSIDREKLPLYIFAGSTTRREMYKLPPFDFWTRISHVIEMQHPLEFDNEVDTKQVASDYIWMFWNSHVREYFSKKKLIVDIKEKKSGSSMDPDYYDPANIYYRELYLFLTSREVIQFVSSEIADEIVGGDQPPLSIRMIRHLVGRSLFRFIETILHPKSMDEPIERFKRSQEASSLNRELQFWGPREWFDRLGKLIEEYRVGPEESSYSKDFQRLFDDLRKKVRQGVRVLN